MTRILARFGVMLFGRSVAVRAVGCLRQKSRKARFPAASGRNTPADWLIVAEARRLRASVGTADSRILEYPHVRTVWSA